MGYDGMSISISRYLYYCFYCYYYCYITLPFLLWSVLVLLVLPYIIIKTITCCYCYYWSLSSLSDHVGKKNLSHQEKTVFPIDMAIPRGSIHVLRMAFGEWHSVGMGQNRSNFTTPCGHRTPNPTNLRDQDGNLTTRRGSFFARKALKTTPQLGDVDCWKKGIRHHHWLVNHQCQHCIISCLVARITVSPCHATNPWNSFRKHVVGMVSFLPFASIYYPFLIWSFTGWFKRTSAGNQVFFPSNIEVSCKNSFKPIQWPWRVKPLALWYNSPTHWNLVG